MNTLVSIMEWVGPGIVIVLAVLCAAFVLIPVILVVWGKWGR